MSGEPARLKQLPTVPPPTPDGGGPSPGGREGRSRGPWTALRPGSLRESGPPSPEPALGFSLLSSEDLPP